VFIIYKRLFLMNKASLIIKKQGWGV